MAFTWVVSPCPCVVLSSLVCQVSVGSSGARSYGPVTGQSALVVCRYPCKAGVLSLRFFRRDYVASLGDLPQRGSTPYGMNHHPRVLPQLRHHAVTQGVPPSARVNRHSMSFGRRSVSPRPPPRERAGGPPHVEATQASPGPRVLEDAVRFGLHRPLFRPDPPPLAKRRRFDHLFGGVRCKVVGEWGGSAH